ncbi:B12-binding domain-containing radical SAM protein [Afifella pfennigii]|uniref:B12-binding domain-containing radical SAM protein n=1 Tax=Afifella pfennigii TaxID=209897 RepID=UPI00047A1314|nr:radical SAM protein [Afifella pfennigii]
MSRKTFKAVLIKPSHYDDDGYVIQWMISSIPSNSLAALYGLIRDCAARKVLGEDVDIDVTPYDETNTVIPFERIIRDIKAADAGFVGLVGVQSNQFPRALDMTRTFRAEGIPVVIGGFHVSGCLAMLDELPDDIKEAQRLGAVIYAGEAEGRMDEIVEAVWQNSLEPLYNYMHDLPGMSRASLPFLPQETVSRTAGKYTSFDSGRGCPFQCSFCTIINVQGRKSRYRTPDDIEEIIRANAAQGIKRFFITDDNFARNKNWEAILDRMIELQAEGLRFKFILQVDTLCHRLEGFIEKAAKAGCNRVFIGLENIDPDALMAAKKRQNKIWEYRKMLQAWKDAGVVTYAGYILGFPDDTPEKIRRNMEILKKELPLDLVEFFFLTPLPGSEDHQKLTREGIWMDPDVNKYDLNHRVSHHPTMSDAEWEAIYRECWEICYDEAHIERVLRRAAARGVKTKQLFHGLGAFYGSVTIEKVHPLEAGFMRRKVRTQRRSGMRLESPLLFYPRYASEVLYKNYRWAMLYLRLRRIWKRVHEDPNKLAYMDEALRPVTEDETTELMTTFEDAIPQTHGAPARRKADEPAHLEAAE